MKTIWRVSILALSASLVLSACGPAQPEPASTPTSPPPALSNTPGAPTSTTAPPPTAAPTQTPLPPSPTPVTSVGWSTTASTRNELSFAFPGQWDGSSPLTFGEGEFVKHPEQPTGVTFQIKLSGNPETLLKNWGSKEIGIVGIVTFQPETVGEGENVTIARVDTPTKIAQGSGITAQVAYIRRASNVMEVMWFAPTDQWESLQPVFQEVIKKIEIWRRYASNAIGLQTMYAHDWLAPSQPWQDSGLWFRSPDERAGLSVFVKNEIADPVQVLESWSAERLAPLGFSGCSIEKGDRMETMGGQWESKTGECSNAAGEKVAYEVTFAPNKNRLLEIITYAPAEQWEEANAVAFRYLLGMMIDIR